MTDKPSATEANLRNLDNYSKNAKYPNGVKPKLVLTDDLKRFLTEDTTPVKKTNKYSNLKGMLNDPMSPYEIPQTPRKFKNLADVVNNKQYRGIYNQTAAPVADYYLQNNIDPPYYIQEWDDECRGNMTIKLMIFLTARNQPWTLERDQDIDEVLAVSRAYYNQLSAFKPSEDNFYVTNSLNMTKIFVEYMTRKSKVYHNKIRLARVDVGQRSIEDILKGLIG